MKNLILLLCILHSSFTYAQLTWDDNEYKLSSSLFVSSDSTLPFWMRSQTFGEVPVESQFLQLKATVHHEYDSTFNRERKLNNFGLGHGASLVGNLGSVNQFLLSEAYVKARWKVFELWAGRRKEFIGLADSTLSSGSLIWGQNALPIPKIQLAIPNYTSILGKGLVSIKGFYAHGWFGSSDSVQNYLLHQKVLYTRVGRPHWNFKFFAGLNHQVQWGGRPSVPFFDRLTNQVIRNFPSDLSTYFKVVSGVSVNRKGDQKQGTNGVPFNEAFNRAGNHLGTIDIGFTYDLPQASIFMYRQSIYEDGSLFYLNNISDGLLGITLKTKSTLKQKVRLNQLNLEYVKTSNQGGEGGSSNTISELRGRDNYFNNSIYKDGWTYSQRSLANSFLMPLREYPMVVERPKRFYGNIHINNRLEAFHMALDVSIQDLQLRGRYSISQSQGSYMFPLDFLRQNSFYLQASKVLNDYKLICSIAFDRGDLLPSTTGVQIGITRQFSY